MSDFALAIDGRCGTDRVNSHRDLVPRATSGGSKRSRIDYPNGPRGLAAFGEVQVIRIVKG